MYLEIALVLIGLTALIISSDIVVARAKKIAYTMGISELFVGLTIVSIGTSLPEIATNVSAGLAVRSGLEGSGIAIGNIIGSEISQITIILGIVGMVAILDVSRRALFRDGFAMIISISGLLVASLDGSVTQIEGIVLASVYIVVI
jgi:cation:H+ antiporter